MGLSVQPGLFLRSESLCCRFMRADAPFGGRYWTVVPIWRCWAFVIRDSSHITMDGCILSSPAIEILNFRHGHFLYSVSSLRYSTGGGAVSLSSRSTRAARSDPSLYTLQGSSQSPLLLYHHPLPYLPCPVRVCTSLGQPTNAELIKNLHF